MFESLFGAETPLPVRFFIAFIVVFVLIGATAWLIRRFGSERLGSQGGRNRQPRLAVIDSTNVDGRRRLVLIRRDNVEHLVMIGGGSDVVVETNIVRGNAASLRESAARTPAADTLPRAVPAEEATSWPLAPEPGPRMRPNLPEDAAQWSQPETAPPRNAPQRQDPPLSAERPARAAPEPKVPQPAAKPDMPLPAGDQNLADIASRLEAALRRTGIDTPPRSAAKPAAAPELRAPERAARPAETARAERVEPRAPQPEPQKADPAKPVSLEQEMASLLGRPTGKTP